MRTTDTHVDAFPSASRSPEHESGNNDPPDAVPVHMLPGSQTVNPDLRIYITVNAKTTERRRHSRVVAEFSLLLNSQRVAGTWAKSSEQGPDLVLIARNALESG